MKTTTAIGALLMTASLASAQPLAWHVTAAGHGRAGAALLVDNDRLYVAGGTGTNGRSVRSYRIDRDLMELVEGRDEASFIANRFNEDRIHKDPLLFGRFIHRMIRHGDFLYAIGSAGVEYSRVDTDGVLSPWQSTAQLPTAPFSTAELLSSGGDLYVLDWGARSTTASAPTPVGRTWRATPNGDGTISSWTLIANTATQYAARIDIHGGVTYLYWANAVHRVDRTESGALSLTQLLAPLAVRPVIVLGTAIADPDRFDLSQGVGLQSLARPDVPRNLVPTGALPFRFDALTGRDGIAFATGAGSGIALLDARVLRDWPVFFRSQSAGAGPASGSGTVAVETVDANTSWTIAGDSSWLTASPNGGTGSTTVTYSFSDNASHDDRSAALTLSRVGDTIGPQFRFFQSGMPPRFEAQPSVVDFPAAGGTATVNWTTSPVDASWNVRPFQSDWHAASPALGIGSAVITFTAQRNTTYEPRTISFYGALTLQQAAAIRPTFEARPSLLEVPSNGGTFTVQWTPSPADAAWDVRPLAQDWWSASPSVGQGPAEIIFTVSRNPTNALRTASVYDALTIRQAPLTPPPAPTSFTAAIGDFAATFSWLPSGSDLLQKFQLEAGSARGGADLAVLTTTERQLRVANIPPGRYFFRVRGVNEAGMGVPSADTEVEMMPNGSSTPLAPQSLSVAIDGRQATLSWQPSAGGGIPQRYRLDVALTPGGVSIFSALTSSTTMPVSNVPVGRYYVRAYAENEAGSSPPSNEVLAAVGTSSTGSPRGLVTTVTVQTVSLNWDAADDADSTTRYLLEVGAQRGRTDLSLPLLSSQTTTTIPSVPPGVYYVRLRAITNTVVSGTSNEVQVIVNP